ncbi:chromate efflux transporter [Paenibacillus ginsengarvi]|uniref:Chromate efflux transporter n=1 Tax=Paenibacillus ginsengarvi TaxID=400777 RepID=A0A3B0CIZ2_9BACL|nr:chromate efflux transporter [Paenibacillus ginsengarvi]RKN84267.1 chromate efflux transporter [Paenibacillus ginsengarvi]
MNIQSEHNSRVSRDGSYLRRLVQIGLASAKLGLTSFGGPIAHIGYFRDEYVTRRKWLDDRSYAELVALCQFLPGPASSQVGIGIGIIRAGIGGGLMAWLGFTLPSVVALVLFALLMQQFDLSQSGAIHGLKVVAVAIVAQALLGMGQKLAAGRTRATIAVGAAIVSVLWQTAFSQVLLIAAAALLGVMLLSKLAEQPGPQLHISVSRTLGFICLAAFFALLVALPLVRQAAPGLWISMFDSFYRSGSLVFGGGHVVLPLLEKEFVPTGWIGAGPFLAGYGAAQAVPGPLFTFAAYLGAVMHGTAGAIVAIVAIFLPAFLLVAGCLPFWSSLRRFSAMQGAIAGVNAAVVGMLLAALYNPLWTTAIVKPPDFALAALLYAGLVFWKLPPWLVVLAGAACGALLSL